MILKSMSSLQISLLNSGHTLNYQLHFTAWRSYRTSRSMCLNVQVNVSKVEHITCHSNCWFLYFLEGKPGRPVFAPLPLSYHTACSSIAPISLNLSTPDHTTASTLAPSSMIFHENYCSSLLVFWFLSCPSSTTPLRVIFLPFKSYYKIVLLKVFQQLLTVPV